MWGKLRARFCESIQSIKQKEVMKMSGRFLKEMGRKVFFLSMGVVLFSLFFLGADVQGQTLPSVIKLGTHPIGSFSNIACSTLATVLTKHSGISVKVMPTSGPTEWLPMIATGEVEGGWLSHYDAQLGRLGRAEYKAATAGKGAPIYLLCTMLPNYSGALTSERSGIKKLSDLKGKRVAAWLSGSPATNALSRSVLANMNVKESYFSSLLTVVGMDGGTRAIIEGKVDATFNAALGMAVVQELEATKGARFLSFDPSPEAFARMQEFYPCFPVTLPPGPGRVGVKEPNTFQVYNFYLVGAEKLSDDAAYTIVKTIWDNREDLIKTHSRFRELTLEQQCFVSNKAIIPYHPGAIKFYKEKGLWGPEMDTLQKKLLAEK